MHKVIALVLGLSLAVESAAETRAVSSQLVTQSLKRVSVSEAIRAAFQSNEDVGIQDETVKQAEESYARAKAALFPTVNLIGTYGRQQTPPAGTARGLSPSEQQTLKLTLAQPLFRGFREWAALRQQQDQSEAAVWSRKQALLEIQQSVSLAYFQAILAEKDLKNLLKEKETHEERLKELKRFKKLGRIRAGDVLNLEATIAILDANLDTARTAVLNSRSTLNLLTGLEKTAELNDELNVPKALESLQFYREKVEQRPDIIALEKNWQASEEGVSIAKGAHLPSLDLAGNYYFKRPGFLENVKWDVQLTLTLPLFQGGSILSETRAAVSERKKSELEYQKAKRKAYEEVENLYLQVQNNLRQMKTQNRAVDLTQKSYAAEVKDYRLGLVNNLDVLQALSAAQSSLRSRDRTEYQLKVDYVQLLGATGKTL